MSFSGLRVEVCDFLLRGEKQVWMENADLSLLLDYHEGGVMRVLCHKPSAVNLLNAWRDDGEPSLGFLDCLLPNVDMNPVQIGLALSLREYLLKDPYDYTISRSESGMEFGL